MYKYLIILLFSLLSFTSCILLLVGEPPQYEVRWYIHNCTENDIIIKTYKSQDTVNSLQKMFFTFREYVETSDVIERREKDLDFNDIHHFWSGYRKIDTSKMVIEMRMITEAVDTALFPKRVWKCIQKDDAGKQFFNRQYWTKNKSGRFREWFYTFEVSSEDFGIDK